MKYGFGLPFADRALIPRRNSASRAVRPAGRAAPPPDKGATRTTRGGAAADPCATAEAAPPGAAFWPAQPAAAQPTTMTTTAKVRGRWDERLRWGPGGIGPPQRIPPSRPDA